MLEVRSSSTTRSETTVVSGAFKTSRMSWTPSERKASVDSLYLFFHRRFPHSSSTFLRPTTSCFCPPAPPTTAVPPHRLFWDVDRTTPGAEGGSKTKKKTGRCVQQPIVVRAWLGGTCLCVFAGVPAALHSCRFLCPTSGSLRIVFVNSARSVLCNPAGTLPYVRPLAFRASIASRLEPVSRENT